MIRTKEYLNIYVRVIYSIYNIIVVYIIMFTSIDVLCTNIYIIYNACAAMYIVKLSISLL